MVKSLADLGMDQKNDMFGTVYPAIKGHSTYGHSSPVFQWDGYPFTSYIEKYWGCQRTTTGGMISHDITNELEGFFS